MTHMKSALHSFFVLLVCLLMTAGLAMAQPPGAGGGDQGDSAQMGGAPMGQQQGGPGGGMQGMQQDPEQMQEMMAQQYKTLLEMGDEEWAVIGPYVLKVASLSQSGQNRSGGMRMMMGGRGNMPGGSADQDQSQGRSQDENASDDQNRRGRGMTAGSGDENLEALQSLLEDESASNSEIKAKLSALRKSREASEQELIAAQKQLRELLTLRQEAMLVVMGLLE